MARTWTAFVVVVLLSACPVWAGDGNGKVKVFILAGQSNMEGLGHTRTLAHLGEDPQYGALLKKIRNDDGSWVVRDDVFISFRGGKTTGPLRGGADKRCRRLWNKADGILGRAKGRRIDGTLPTCAVNTAAYDA